MLGRGVPIFAEEIAMSSLVFVLLPFDEIDCWPLLVLGGIFIMTFVIAYQLMFNPEARMRRKLEMARKNLDPSYWGSYDK